MGRVESGLQRRPVAVGGEGRARDRVDLGALGLEHFVSQPRTGDPADVSKWLASHLHFSFSLPNFPSAPGEPKQYALVGARFVRFEGQDIAYLAYTMNQRPISLLVASNVTNIIPDKYESYKSGSLVFHFSSQNGLKLISWRDHGLSYALVSDLEIGGAESCIICHGSRSERQRFENLLRLNPAPPMTSGVH